MPANKPGRLMSPSTIKYRIVDVHVNHKYRIVDVPVNPFLLFILLCKSCSNENNERQGCRSSGFYERQGCRSSGFVNDRDVNFFGRVIDVFN